MATVPLAQAETQRAELMRLRDEAQYAANRIWEVAQTLRQLEQALHPLWGQAKMSLEYDKSVWILYQRRLLDCAVRLECL